MADMMGYKIGEKIDAFFIKDDSGPKKRKFTVQIRRLYYKRECENARTD